MLYFDHAASSPLREDVAQTFFEAVRRDVGNPSSQHRLGRSLQSEIEQVRNEMIKMFGDESSTDLIFTSSATESNNQVIRGLKEKLKEKQQIFLGFSGDHASLAQPLKSLESEGIEGHLLPHPPRDEERNLNWKQAFSRLKENEDREVGFVALTHVNNQSGDLFPAADVLPFLRQIFPEAHLHLDIVQSFTKIDENWRDMDVDTLSFSSHKLGGPKGVAGLVLKNKCQIPPLLRGGGQEKGFRSSTQCFALIKGLNRAILSCQKELETFPLEQAREKKKLLQRELVKNLGERVVFPFKEASASPYILSFLIRGVSSDILIRHLEERDVFVSSSSACSSREKKYHPAFESLGIDPQDHPYVVRISFVPKTSIEDIQNLTRNFKEVVEDLEFLFK